MELTYRTRRTLKRAGLIALVSALILTALWGCWMVWVERHIVYTRSGAVLDFHREYGEGELAVTPESQPPVSIYYDDGTDFAPVDMSLQQITGYYITLDMMAADMETIRATIAALPVGSAVMMEVKGIKGHAYYTTGVSNVPLTTALDPTAVDQLIADIASRNLYFIATLPAFRDRNFGLVKTSCGLPFIGGQGALWLDSSNCYWMDPTKRGSLDFLTYFVTELRELGFDEVLFTDFCFPDSPDIEFAGDRITAIQSAAATLVAECATDRFAVSFLATGSTVQPVAGRSRLYLTDVEAADAAATAGSFGLADPAVNVVFLTDSFDTRYESFSVLRPMTSAVTG